MSTYVVCGYEALWVGKMNISVINLYGITKYQSRAGYGEHICESRNEVLIER